jgi:LemA protein
MAQAKTVQTAQASWTSRNKWLIAIIVIIVIVVLWFVGTYNALIAADQNIKNAWANVETQYQRRVDLIPNLVNSVKGYMTYEQNLLTQITALRSQWMAATTTEQKVEKTNQIEAALKTIFASFENYPALKADTTVTGLMDELAGTENRISVARTNFNEAVKNYNNLVKFIPSNIVAGWMGYIEKTMFEAITGAEKVPIVNLTA